MAELTLDAFLNQLNDRDALEKSLPAGRSLMTPRECGVFYGPEDIASGKAPSVMVGFSNTPEGAQEWEALAQAYIASDYHAKVLAIQNSWSPTPATTTPTTPPARRRTILER